MRSGLLLHKRSLLKERKLLNLNWVILNTLTICVQAYFIFKVATKFYEKEKSLENICSHLSTDHMLASFVCSISIGKRLHSKVILYCMETRSLLGSFFLNISIIISSLLLNFSVVAFTPYRNDPLMVIAAVVGILFINDLDFVFGDWFGIQIFKNHQQIHIITCPKTIKKNQTQIDTAYWWVTAILILNMTSIILLYVNHVKENCLMFKTSIFEGNQPKIMMALVIINSV